MKLAIYKIKECISNADWPGAVAALADNYGLQMPPEYKLDVMRGSIFPSEVELFYNNNIYIWSERTGLSCYSRSMPRPMIAADIYVSRM